MPLTPRELSLWEKVLLQNKGGHFYRLYEYILDLFLKMETSVHLSPENYGVDPRHSVVYVPSDWWGFPFAFSRLNLSKDIVVMDLGCGKGRVLRHLAKKCQKAYGIDILPPAIKQAEKNLRSFKNLEIYLGDARTFEFPSGIDVFYAFNPFSWDSLLQVLHRLNAYAIKENKKVYFLYHAPAYHDLIQQITFMHDLSDSYFPAKLKEEFRYYEISF